MAHDNDESPPSPRTSNRFLLIAGVAGACALGVGAGLWARPLAVERDPTLAAAKPVEPPKRTGRLQIVLDDSPAPIGKPIEVLPDSAGDHVQPAAALAPVFIAPPPEPEQMAPTRPATGLVRVQAVVAPPEVAPPAPRPDPRKLEADARRAIAAEQARKAEKARLESVKLQKVQLEKVKADKAQKAAKAEKLRVAKAEKAEKAAEVRRFADRAAKAKAEKVQLAKAARREAEEARLAEAQRAGALRRLARAVARVVPHHRAEPPKVELADARPAKAKPSVSKKKCVSPDPGAAIVCADPALATADKRLGRAYREARAAGVSEAQLERQQQRWLMARSAAAREAPWAVHDVYLARIAELNDQARDARTTGY